MASQADRPTARRIVAPGAPRVALVLAWAALLAFLARSLIDFRYVYPEQIPDTASNTLAILVYTAIFGGWIVALGALAAGIRSGAVACLAFAALPILLGLTTAVAFCPMPCSTAAPVGDVLNLVCLALGGLSAVSLAASLRSWSAS
jgi:hypothetical protein